MRITLEATKAGEGTAMATELVAKFQAEAGRALRMFCEVRTKIWGQNLLDP